MYQLALFSFLILFLSCDSSRRIETVVDNQSPPEQEQFQAKLSNQNSFGAKSLDQFCQSWPILNGDSFVSTEKDHLSTRIHQLSEERGSCLSSHLIFDQLPIQLAEIKFQKKESEYLIFELNHQGQIRDFEFIEKKLLEISPVKIPMKDGKTLFGFLFKKQGTERLIFQRTPYLHTSFSIQTNRVKSFLEKDFSVFIQSIRGSYLSEGNFHWLSKTEIQDAETTLEWLEENTQFKQVIAYGASYDGFNALASGLTGHKLLTHVIACSAPTKAILDSYTSGGAIEFGLLQYLWEVQFYRGEKTHRFLDKLNSLIDRKIELSNWDNDIFGQDLPDWELLLEAKRDSRHEFWKRRSILEQIHLIDKPIQFVAGFDNDQDSLDVVRLQETLKNKNNFAGRHFYYHQNRHGCGDFLYHGLFEEFLSSQSNKDVFLVKYQDREGNLFEPRQEARLKKKKILLSNLARTKFSDPYPLLEIIGDGAAKSFDFIYTFEENAETIGPMFLHLDLLGEIGDRPVQVAVSKIDLDGDQLPLHTMSSANRGRLLFQAPELNFDYGLLEKEVIFPPISHQFKAGESLFFTIRLSDNKDRLNPDLPRNYYLAFPNFQNLGSYVEFRVLE